MRNFVNCSHARGSTFSLPTMVNLWRTPCMSARAGQILMHLKKREESRS